MAFLARSTRMSRRVLVLMMRTFRGAHGKTLETGFDEAACLYLEELLPLEDAGEGVRAFVEKRRPVWKLR